MRKRLTDRYLQSIKPPATGRLEIVDEVQRNLRLRVTPNGVMSWSVNKRVAGRNRRFSIGHYPDKPLAQARDEAGTLLAEVTVGRDPVAEARDARRRVEQPAPVTVAEAIDLFIATRAHLRTQREIELRLRRELADHLSRPVEDVSAADLARIVDRKAAVAPIGANRVVAALQPFWKWLARRGYCDNVAAHLVKPSRERARDRALDLAEVQAIYAAAGEIGAPFGSIVRLLALTLQRRTEVAGMRWREIDFGAATWTIPGERTKTAAGHIVHLPAPALAELRALRQQRDAEAKAAAAKGEPFTDSPLVFTTNGETAFSGFSKAKRRLDEKAGVTDWRLHDLRRSGVTALADRGIDAVVLDKLLNHVGAGTLGTVQRVYQRSAMLDQRKAALNLWAEIITNAAKTMSDVVVPFKKGDA